SVLHILAQGLSDVTSHMEPMEAAAVCGQAVAALTRAMTRTTDPVALQSLAWGLLAVADRLEPKAAAATLRQALTTMTGPWMIPTETVDPSEAASYRLEDRLTAVADRLEPKEAGEVADTF